MPVDLLMQIREAAGSPAPLPDDRIRDEELPYAELIALQVKAGFDRSSTLRLLRVQGDALRRMAETESAFWEAEFVRPAMEAGKRPDEVLGAEFGDRMAAMMERAIMAMYHLQQTQAWTAGLIAGVEMQLAGAGLHTRLEHPPAMCFLDITGYTRLTQERGDAAAAASGGAARPARRSAQRSGTLAGRSSGSATGSCSSSRTRARAWSPPWRWSTGVVEAGMPPAHVGLHAGPVIFQEGDYYGQTVNVASRIADYARPGEVLVTETVVDASAGADVVFRDVGPVDLKGVAGAVRLYAARRPG